jgi:ubiquinone biosynthesis protein COQ9
MLSRDGWPLKPDVRRYDAVKGHGMDIAAEPRLEQAPENLKRHIVQTALRLAHDAGTWDAVHVHAVARHGGIGLQELQRHFADKDAIAEGCFDIADEALLLLADPPGWSRLPIRERLHAAIMSWLAALQPHRHLVAEMLRYKLHPEHLHLQALGIARISRTVQWIREVAMLPAVGWRREVEEAVLTSVYLATFAFWLRDSSRDSEHTRHLLARLLASAERGALWLWWDRG